MKIIGCKVTNLLTVAGKLINSTFITFKKKQLEVDYIIGNVTLTKH